MPVRLLIAMALLGGLAMSPARAAAPPPRLLVTPVVLVDLAPPDQRYDQVEDAARATRISARMRRALDASRRWRVMAAGAHPPYRYLDCKRCVVDWARRLGADQLLVGWVQKESRLILSVNLVLIDLRHGETRHDATVELRGDTDATWQAGTAQVLERLTGVELGD
jgi:hypothetical protein